MFSKILYFLGSAFCAQEAAHSFFYQGQKMPLDARCTGIYLGFLIVFVFWLFKIKKRPANVFSLSLLAPIVLSILYFVFDGFSSIFGAGWVTNFTRLFSGLFFGQAAGILILLILSHSFWGNLSKKVKIISWQGYLILFFINLAILFLFWFDLPIIFYWAGFWGIFGLIIGVFLFNLAGLSVIFSKNLSLTKKRIDFFIGAFALILFEFSFLIWLRNFLGA